MMQPESIRIEGQALIIKMRINMCQKTLTIEELVGRAKTLQIELFDNMYRELVVEHGKHVYEEGGEGVEKQEESEEKQEEGEG
jgi:hypothetical protein